MIKEQTLPKWFNGNLYKKGDTVQNRFSGETFKLNAMELSMYDFVMGCAMLPSNILSDKNIKNWQDGLSWFRTHNSKAYMVLLD